ncbi:MAG: hypothetical protein ACRDOB_02070 [Streptosporangiaceae bacterium]
MSLSAREQQALDVMAEHIAGSDPGLAAKMATFTRLTAGEDLPLREKILAVRTRDTRHLFRLPRRPGFQRSALLLWLVIVVGLVAVAVAIGNGSRAACAKARPAACAGSSPGQLPSSPAYRTPANSTLHGI